MVAFRHVADWKPRATHTLPQRKGFLLMGQHHRSISHQNHYADTTPPKAVLQHGSHEAPQATSDWVRIPAICIVLAPKLVTIVEATIPIICDGLKCNNSKRASRSVAGRSSIIHLSVGGKLFQLLVGCRVDDFVVVQRHTRVWLVFLSRLHASNDEVNPWQGCARDHKGPALGHFRHPDKHLDCATTCAFSPSVSLFRTYGLTRRL